VEDPDGAGDRFGRQKVAADAGELTSGFVVRRLEALLEEFGDAPDADEARARIALAQYRRGKWVRAIRIGDTHGWVWSERSLTDNEWRIRFNRRASGRPTVFKSAENGVTVSAPVGVIRLKGPEAAVIKVSTKK